MLHKHELRVWFLHFICTWHGYVQKQNNYTDALIILSIDSWWLSCCFVLHHHTWVSNLLCCCHEVQSPIFTVSDLYRLSLGTKIERQCSSQPLTLTIRSLSGCHYCCHLYNAFSCPRLVDSVELMQLHWFSLAFVSFLSFSNCTYYNLMGW